MYTLVIAIHNIFRWIVVILLVGSIVIAYRGWLMKLNWTEIDRRTGFFATIAVDIQLLLGVLLYFFLSPVTRDFLQNFGTAMQDPKLRFFGIEHVGFMVLGVVFAHLGSTLPRKTTEALGKHKRAALAFSLAALMIVAGMPWTRPLLPGLAGVP